VIRRKLLRAVVGRLDAARARFTLGARVGARVRVLGMPSLAVEGELVVGARTVLVSTPAPITIVVRSGGHLEIGEDVLVESGAVIRAKGRVVIGRGARIGFGCIVDDETANGELFIPDGAWIADGTVVTGTNELHQLPKANGAAKDATRERVRDVVCGIVAAASELDDASDLRHARGFDSLAALRVLVALEKELGVSFPHDLFARPRTFDSLAAIARGDAPP
jgi:acyl carrier protein